MTLSTNVHHLLLAYNGLTNFAGGPDLPWVLETYEQLDDSTVRKMIWALSYSWGAGQLAAGYYQGNVECLAQALFTALPTWDDTLPREEKVRWLQRLGVDTILPEPEPRPTTPDCYPTANESAIDGLEHAAIEDMATYFRIGIPETTLLYRLGRALSQATLMPAATELSLNG